MDRARDERRVRLGRLTCAWPQLVEERQLHAAVPAAANRAIEVEGERHEPAHRDDDLQDPQRWVGVGDPPNAVDHKRQGHEAQHRGQWPVAAESITSEADW
jgi:hypothetical protein